MQPSLQTSLQRIWQCGIFFLALLPNTGHADSIVTGGKTGTYYEIGNNLRDIVAPALIVKDSKGSWANVEELSKTKGVSLAIVQSDVYAALVRLRDDPEVPKRIRWEYGQLLNNLRVFMPLYKEEIHFLVRKDDPIEFIHQIKGKQIWMDAEKSGTYLTALNIYSKMFKEPPQTVEPFLNPSATGEDDGTRRRRSALISLSVPGLLPTAPKIDVMVLVGGQPLSLLAKSIPDNLKLLKFDPAHSSSAELLKSYQAADIQRASYPLLNIDGQSQPSLAVDSYLITANFANPQRNQFMNDFATQFCDKFSQLQARGHKKWKALNWQPGAPLPELAAGWSYAEKVKQRLESCGGSVPQKQITGGCTPAFRAANLCK
jgi:hypothetical protein